MKHQDRRLLHYLQDIVEAQERIAEYVDHSDFDAFLANRMMQDAVIRNFEVIGEASKHLLQRFKAFVDAHPELPLAKAYGLRNIVTHGYHDVDFQVIWDTTRHDLPELAQQLRICLQSFASPSQEP